MMAPEKPIFIDQGNGTYTKYEGPFEALGVRGWPDFLPPGSLPPNSARSVSSGLDHLYSRSDIPADLLTLKEPGIKDWEVFKSFVTKALAG
jgi:hypothetical protein